MEILPMQWLAEPARYAGDRLTRQPDTAGIIPMPPTGQVWGFPSIAGTSQRTDLLIKKPLNGQQPGRTRIRIPSAFLATSKASYWSGRRTRTESNRRVLLLLLMVFAILFMKWLFSWKGVMSIPFLNAISPQLGEPHQISPNLSIHSPKPVITLNFYLSEEGWNNFYPFMSLISGRKKFNR